jgi:hypothetical protein
MPFEAVEPEPMTIPPPPSSYESMPEPNQVVTSAGWSVVAHESKGDAITPETKPSKKAQAKQDPHLTESWLLAAGGPTTDESEEGEPKPNMSRALAQYAILVVGLVMVLVGVIVMVANSH